VKKNIIPIHRSLFILFIVLDMVVEVYTIVFYVVVVVFVVQLR